MALLNKPPHGESAIASVFQPATQYPHLARVYATKKHQLAVCPTLGRLWKQQFTLGYCIKAYKGRAHSINILEPTVGLPTFYTTLILLHSFLYVRVENIRVFILNLIPSTSCNLYQNPHRKIGNNRI